MPQNNDSNHGIAVCRSDLEHQREETLLAQGHTHVKKGLDVELDIISLCDMFFIYLI